MVKNRVDRGGSKRGSEAGNCLDNPAVKDVGVARAELLASSPHKPLTEKDIYVLDEDKDGTYLEPCKYDMFFKKDVLSALRLLKEKIVQPNISWEDVLPLIDECFQLKDG